MVERENMMDVRQGFSRASILHLLPKPSGAKTKAALQLKDRGGVTFANQERVLVIWSGTGREVSLTT